MEKTRRERMRQATIQEIKNNAAKQIAQQGNTEISLRAVARHMGMTAPALYRYFKNRDELVTAVVLDSMESFRQTLTEARESHPPDDIAGRLFEIFTSWRRWALENPVAYSLFSSNPWPSYKPPWTTINDASTGAAAVIMDLYGEAWSQGLLTIPEEYSDLPEEYRRELEELSRRRNYKVPLEVVHLSLYGWGLVHGLIMLDLSGRWTYLLDDPCQVFRFQMLKELSRFGLVPADPRPCPPKQVAAEN